MPTDKTDGLSFETVKSYKLAAEEHVKNDKTISEKDRKHTEAEYNGIAKATSRFLRVGEGRKHDGRIVEAVTTHNTLLPPMSLTGKDHKEVVDKERGPKRRAVVSANEGPNVRVSNLTARILNEVADLEDSKTECKSTEGLQAKVEDLNKRLLKEAFDDETLKLKEKWLLAA